MAFVLSLAAVLLFLAVLPVTVPFVIIDHKLSTGRMRRQAARTLCTCCAHLLGRNALDRANELQAVRFASFPPDVRPRIVRLADAVCTVCGTHYRFAQGHFTLVPRPPAASDQAIVTRPGGTPF